MHVVTLGIQNATPMSLLSHGLILRQRPIQVAIFPSTHLRLNVFELSRISTLLWVGSTPNAQGPLTNGIINLRWHSRVPSWRGARHEVLHEWRTLTWQERVFCDKFTFVQHCYMVENSMTSLFTFWDLDFKTKYWILECSWTSLNFFLLIVANLL